MVYVIKSVAVASAAVTVKTGDVVVSASVVVYKVVPRLGEGAAPGLASAGLQVIEDAGKGYSDFQRLGRAAVAAGIGGASYLVGVFVGAGCEIFTAPETAAASSPGCAFLGFAAQAGASYIGSQWVAPFVDQAVGFGK